MLIVSDTNILSSFSAGGAFELLLQLFPEKSINIPPAVEQELLHGITRGQDHLKTIFLKEKFKCSTCQRKKKMKQEHYL